MVENILQFATKSNKFAEAEKYPTACLMLSISHIISEFSEHGFFVEPMSLVFFCTFQAHKPRKRLIFKTSFLKFLKRAIIIPPKNVLHVVN